jgi:hypothetical protein
MSDARFTVTDPQAPARLVSPGLRTQAEAVMAEAKANTPVITGTLRRGWRTARDAELSWAVLNDTPYAVYVEFGYRTRSGRRVAGQAMLGRALARARAAQG